MASYKEPGVYLTPVNAVYGVYSGVQMYPCIIGPGAKILPAKSVLMTREPASSALDDKLPCSKVTSINKISLYDGGPSVYELDVDYNVVDNCYIHWLDDKGPDYGASYYVDYDYEVESDIYDLTLVTSLDELHAKYGESIRNCEIGKPVNTLVAAAELAFKNNGETRPIFVQQVLCQTEVPTENEFRVGLAKTEVEDRIWRVIPTVVTNEIVSAVRESIAKCSSYEERKERTTIITTPYNEQRLEPTTASGVINTVGGYAESLKDKRVCLLYPDSVEITLSDEQLHKVSGQMVAAAIAGREQTFVCSKSLTRMRIAGFHRLNGVTMTRSQTNMLAACGVMILTQSDVDADVIIRHQLTTNMTDIQSREASITAISDYCSKQFRSACETYIGVYNINSETISMISGTLKLMIAQMVKEGAINSGTVANVVQDADNPDTVLATVRVAVPYPCNYIDITMYLD